MFPRHEVQDGDEGDVRGKEGDEPDAEELVYGDVEDEVFGIVCYHHRIRLAKALQSRPIILSPPPWFGLREGSVKTYQRYPH